MTRSFKDRSATEFIYMVLGVVAIVAASAAWSGLVLSLLWAWFFVPAFGAPHLTIVQAIGAALVVRWLCRDDKESNSDKPLKDVARLFLEPTLVLLVGWVVKQLL
jgi:hypothetical protein